MKSVFGLEGQKALVVGGGYGSGRITCKFFRVPYRGYFERFQEGQLVRVIGKITSYRGTLEFHHPDIHPVGETEENVNQIVPIYTELDGISSAKFEKLVNAAFGKATAARNPRIMQGSIRFSF